MYYSKRSVTNGISSAISIRCAAQEALANARKYARSSRVMVTLSYMDAMVVLNAEKRRKRVKSKALVTSQGCCKIGNKIERSGSAEGGSPLPGSPSPGETRGEGVSPKTSFPSFRSPPQAAKRTLQQPW